MKRTTLLLALVLFVSGVVRAERPGGFEVIGPGGGGAMFHPIVSPHDPSTILDACDMTGSYITHNGGASWRMFNLRGVVRFFVFDPTLPNVIYAQNDNLWRSRDSGETWTLVSPPPSTIQSISMASDHSDEKVISSSEVPGSITALAIDPSDSNHLYVAGDEGTPGLFESQDMGAHWTRTTDLPEVVNHIWISGKPAKSILAIGKHRIVEGRDEKFRVSSTTFEITAASAGRADSGAWTIYATSEAGIAVSTDAGASWKNSPLPGTGAHVRAIATSFPHPQTAYVS